MNAERFEKLVDTRIAHCRKVLLEKNEEYSRDGERLHNFKTAARIDDVVPESALWGMCRKHIVSIRDMVADAERGIAPTQKMIDDKLTDWINYALLLEGLLVERMEKTQKNSYTATVTVPGWANIPANTGIGNLVKGVNG